MPDETYPEDRDLTVTSDLQSSFENKQIYHELGNYGMIALNPGKVEVDSIPVESTRVFIRTLQKFFSQTDVNPEPPPPPSPPNPPLHPTMNTPTEPPHLSYTIIATGASGSGKTTVLQQSLRQLLGLGTNSDPSSLEVLNKLELDLIIVEAMGNARTRNNPDSSRCGKLIQVDQIGTPQIRSSIRAIVLEGSRLQHLRLSSSSSSSSERTFHIFYYLLSHGHPALPSSLVEEYQGQYDIDHCIEQYEKINRAMLSKRSPESVKSTWTILAGIILLMNSRKMDDPYLISAKKILGIGEDVGMVPVGTSPEGTKAILARFAVNLYRRTFSFWTNLSSVKPPTGLNISFIDICGSEDLERNRLAQLIINDWNDRVQKQYELTALRGFEEANQTTGQKVGQDYSKLLQDNLAAMLLYLRERPTESQFKDWLFSRRGQKDPRLSVTGVGSYKVQVEHLSGLIVAYQHRQMVWDNLDTKFPDLIEACVPLRSILIPGKRESVVPTSLLKRAEKDWEKVSAACQRAKVFYIRCVKASDDLSPWKFDRDQVVPQVRSLAIGRTFDLLRSFNLEHADSWDNFVMKTAGNLAANEKKSGRNSTSQERYDFVKRLMQSLSSGEEAAWSKDILLQGNYVHYSGRVNSRMIELAKERAKQAAVQRETQIPSEKLSGRVDKHAAPSNACSPAVPGRQQGNSDEWRKAVRSQPPYSESAEWQQAFKENVLRPFQRYFMRETRSIQSAEAERVLEALLGHQIYTTWVAKDLVALEVRSGLICDFLEELMLGSLGEEGQNQQVVGHRLARTMCLLLEKQAYVNPQADISRLCSKFAIRLDSLRLSP